MFASENEVLIVDEWESEESARRFVEPPDVRRILLDDLGLRPTEVVFAERVAIPDEVG